MENKYREEKGFEDFSPRVFQLLEVMEMKMNFHFIFYLSPHYVHQRMLWKLSEECVLRKMDCVKCN